MIDSPDQVDLHVFNSATLADGWWSILDGNGFNMPTLADALTFAQEELAELADVLLRHQTDGYSRERDREGGVFEERLSHEFEDVFAMLATAAHHAIPLVKQAGKLLPFTVGGSDNFTGLAQATLRARGFNDPQALISLATLWTASVRSAIPMAPYHELQPPNVLKWYSVVGGIEIAWRAVECLMLTLPEMDINQFNKLKPVGLVDDFFQRKEDKFCNK